MDTAQRGMGLDWPGALELITRTKAELPDALVFNGCGTDQLDPADARSLDDVRRAYLEQVEAIQKVGGRDHPDGEPGARQGRRNCRTTT